MGSRIGVGFTSTALPTYPIKEPFKRSQIKGRHGGSSVWFLVGGGMDYGDYYWGKLSTRQTSPIGTIVAPFGAAYLESDKVIPKTTYYGAYGQGCFRGLGHACIRLQFGLWNVGCRVERSFRSQGLGFRLWFEFSVGGWSLL